MFVFLITLFEKTIISPLGDRPLKGLDFVKGLDFESASLAGAEVS